MRGSLLTLDARAARVRRGRRRCTDKGTDATASARRRRSRSRRSSAPKPTTRRRDARITGGGARGDAESSIDAERLFGAIVKVSTRAVPEARSNATLGREREGTGVVIGKDGLVLTIGYLIVEADDVKVTDARGRTLPAQVVGYDHNSGFGLVRTMLPLDAQPVRARRFDAHRREGPRADRERRRRWRLVRVRRVQARVHRQLGIPARLGDLHEPARRSTGAARR